MVLKPEPLFDAIEEISSLQTTVVYMAPDGERFTSELAKEFSKLQHVVLFERSLRGNRSKSADQIVHREVSIGDYVLTNGALYASVLIDSVARHVPGVLGDDQSLLGESFEDNLLGCPQYTRPEDFRGFKVPEVLLSGNHEAIARCAHERRVEKTRRLRPDLKTITNQ